MYSLHYVCPPANACGIVTVRLLEARPCGGSVEAKNISCDARSPSEGMLGVVSLAPNVSRLWYNDTLALCNYLLVKRDMMGSHAL